MYRTARQERQIADTIATFFRTNMSPFAVADIALRQFVDVIKHTDIDNAHQQTVAGFSRGSMCNIGAYWMHPGLLNIAALAYTMNVVSVMCKQIGVAEDTDTYHTIMSDFTTPDYLTGVQRAIIQMVNMNNLKIGYNQAIADVTYHAAVQKLLA